MESLGLCKNIRRLSARGGHWLLGLLCLVAAHAASADNMAVGTNLAGVNDYSAQVFTDIMKHGRWWQTKAENGGGGRTKQAGNMPVDQNGWPTQVPFAGDDGQQHYPYSVWIRSDTSPFPAGTYKMVVEGSGELRVNIDSSWETIQLSGGERVIDLKRERPQANIILEIRESVKGDHIRNIRIITPGYYDANNAPAYTTQTFFQPYLDLLEPFTLLRFMDWGHTNNSDNESWSERTLPTSYTQTQSAGVALEYWIEIANLLGTDVWVNVPHKADESWARGMAEMLEDRLHSDAKIYVEYSNEIWNFSHTNYVRDLGKDWWPDLDDNLALNYAFAKRSAWMWQIFLDELSNDARLVKLLAGQSANSWIMSKRLEGLESDLSPAVNPNNLKADGLAIAPYFSYNNAAATDNFSGSFSGASDGRPSVTAARWVNNSWRLNGDITPTIEDKKAVLKKNASITQEVDLSNSIGGEAGLHFLWGAEGLESGDTVEAQLNDGSGWTTVFSADAGDSDGSMQWAFLNPLPASINTGSNVQLRFRVRGDDNNDTFIVDSVNVNAYPTKDWLLDTLAVDQIQNVRRDNVQNHQALANQYGAEVVAYEGGQHFSARGATNRDDYLIDMMHEANADPRMGERYLEYLDMLSEEGMTMFANFSDVGPWGRFGSWTLIESLSETRDDQPKLDAILTWMEQNPTDDDDTPPPPANNSPVADAGSNQSVADSDGNGSETVTLDGSGSYDPDSGDSLSYDWNWNGGSASGVKPSVTLAAGSVHTITLTVSDNDGASDSDTVSITVENAADDDSGDDGSGGDDSSGGDDGSSGGDDNTGGGGDGSSGGGDGSSGGDGGSIGADYSDAFNDNDISDWSANGGNWVANDGAVVHSANQGNPAKILTYNGGSDWRDYSFAVEMHSPDDDPMGVVFYHQDAQNFLGFFMTADFDGGPRWVLFQVADGQRSVLDTAPRGYTANQVYTVEVSVDTGGDIVVSSDGTTLSAATPAGLEGGSIGFYTEWNNGATFDNLIAVVNGGAAPAGDLSATVEIDMWSQYDGFVFRAANHSSATGIAMIEMLANGGGSFDTFGSDDTFSVTPELGGNNDGTTSTAIILDFGDGLVAGASVSAGSSGNYGAGDIDGNLESIDVTVIFNDGTELGGRMSNVGDDDDGDSDLYRIDVEAAGTDTGSGDDTPDGLSAAAPSLTVEAEHAANKNADNFAPWEVAGSYIVWDNGGEFAIQRPASDDNPGTAEYPLTLAEDGDLDLRVKARFDNGEQNSFFVKLQGHDSNWHQINNLTTGGFEWLGANVWNGVEAGQYTVLLQVREANTEVDQLYISIDGSDPE